MSPDLRRATGCTTAYTYFTSLIVAWYLTRLLAGACASALTAPPIHSVAVRNLVITQSSCVCICHKINHEGHEGKATFQRSSFVSFVIIAVFYRKSLKRRPHS